MAVNARRSRSNAQSIIETVVGIIFLIPIVLFLFDIGILVLANTANDNLAKQAARAAGGAAPPPPVDPQLMVPMSASDPNRGARRNLFKGPALAAADKVINTYKATSKSSFMTDISRAQMYYDGEALGPGTGPATVDPGPSNVSVVVHMTARAPVPFPGFDTTREFYARAVEPIVALPPDKEP
jgi:hypothetical protein